MFSDSKFSKIVWGKSAAVSASSSSSSYNEGIGFEPTPVMGTLSNWPALSEARNVKATEPIKPSPPTQQKTPLRDNNSQVPFKTVSMVYRNFTISFHWVREYNVLL
jgi:hypothetical protein